MAEHGRLIDVDKMKADLLTVDPQYQTMIDWCITVLDAQPTIEPERKKGNWIPVSELPKFVEFAVEWLEVTERLRKSGADLKRIQIVAKESEDPDD